MPIGDPEQVARRLQTQQDMEFQLLRAKNERQELELAHLREQVKQQDDDFIV